MGLDSLGVAGLGEDLEKLIVGKEEEARKDKPRGLEVVLISVQKWPFCDSALWYLQLDSLETNFCCSATTASQFLLCNREISATLLLQWQNVSQLRNILLFCYSATPVAECFALAKYYVILLLYSQNNNSRVFHQVPIKLCHYRCLYSL